MRDGPARSRGWQPAAIGTVGRRAVAWFLTDGLAVTATDADARKHAMDIVLVVGYFHPVDE